MSNRYTLCGPLSSRALLVSISVFVSALYAEAPIDRNRMTPVAWDWKAVSDYHDATVKVSLGSATGTGVIIHVDEAKPIGDGYQGYCLTALHVVETDGDQRRVKVAYKNGRRSKNCAVVYEDKENDLALVWVWVPQEIAPVPLASQPARPHDLLEFAGLGGGEQLKCCLRNFTGYASDPTEPQVIFANVSLLPGDSGGPIFNKQGELVGIISGGWFWFDGGAKSSAGNQVQATWPARGANLAALETAVAKIEMQAESERRKDELLVANPATKR